MLEGLEVSIIEYSEVLKDNNNKRIDSEYFKKEFLGFFKNVKNIEFLGSFVKNGYRVVYENTKIIDKIEAIEKNFPYFLQATDLNTPFINKNNLFYVNKEDWKRYPNGRIKKGELLIEVKGKIDKVSIVPEDFPDYTLVSGSLFKLTVNEKISKHILLTYLISKFGIAFKDRYKTNLLISYVSKPDLYRIPVPNFKILFQKKIDYLFDKLFHLNRISQQSYSQAEAILLETLGLNNFSPSNEPVNIKNFKESFLSSGRLDAEYYQKKYEEVINHITIQKHDKLNNLVKIKKSIEPGSDVYSDEGIPFLRVSDFNKFGISEAEKKLSNSFCEDNKELIKKLRPKKETILFSKDGSVGTAYMLRKDENIITSGAILHLTVRNKNEILPEYLTLVLNSKLIQMQAERDSGGSIILHWRINEIENVIVPIIEYSKQQEIAELVEESFRLKKQSEELLETAKRAVEIAIEENEDVAMEYIANFNLPKALNLRKVT